MREAVETRPAVLASVRRVGGDGLAEAIDPGDPDWGPVVVVVPGGVVAGQAGELVRLGPSRGYPSGRWAFRRPGRISETGEHDR